MTYFCVLPVGTGPTRQVANQAYLLMDNWDDWFKYSTLYSLVIFDEVGERHNIGGVKIGQFAMGEGQRRRIYQSGSMNSTSVSSPSARTTAITTI